MKKWTIIVLIILVLLMGSKIGCDHYKANDKILTYELENRDLKKSYDSLGRETVKLEGVLVSEKTLKEAKIKELNKFKDELKNVKNLVSYYGIKGEASNNLRTRINKVDTVYLVKNKIDTLILDTVRTKSINFDYRDEWTIINGKYIEYNDRADSIDIIYSVDTDIEILHAWKRPGFLKRKVPEITIKFNNPNVKTQEVKTIIKRKKRGFFAWLFGF